MAVVWLSGRTSLFGTLLAALSVLAFMQVIDRGSVKGTMPMWTALAVYLLLRQNSGAFGISNAPPFYQFLTDPFAVGRNIVEYADRAMTFGLLVTGAAMAALGRGSRLERDDHRLIMKGLAWVAGGFVLTIWLPVRSSRYVVFPSVGFALVVAVVVSAAASQAAATRAMKVAAAGLLVPLLLLPVYWSLLQTDLP